MEQQTQCSNSLSLFVLVGALALTSAGAVHGQLFAPRVDYPVGDGPHSIVMVDLDGDGDLDLATANLFSHDVSTLPNAGDGTFLGTVVNHPVGWQPITVAAADLDGDGDSDLVTANYLGGPAASFDGNVSVLLNGGVATFDPAVHYAAGDQPWGITVADFNLDGYADLAVANLFGEEVTLHLNDGDLDGDGIGEATFAPAISYPLGLRLYTVLAIDVDGDGDQDLAVSAESSLLVIYLNQGGTLVLDVFYSAATTAGAPMGMSSGDLDGDGYPDLAFATHGTYEASVLINNSPDTTWGIFGGPTAYTVGPQLESVAIGDLDGDGWPDLAVGNTFSDDVSVLLNNGDGTLAPAVSYPTGDRAQSVAIGDLDGDGLNDMAVANEVDDTVSVFLRRVTFDELLAVIDAIDYGIYAWLETDLLDLAAMAQTSYLAGAEKDAAELLCELLEAASERYLRSKSRKRIHDTVRMLAEHLGFGLPCRDLKRSKG